jgi:4-amino-4-deoxy-L-arabinose transferase-like glycosyltransferase
VVKINAAISSLTRLYTYVLAWTDNQPLTFLTLIFLVALVLNTMCVWRHPPDIRSEPSLWLIARNVAHNRGYVICEPDYFPFCGPTNEETAEREPVPVMLYAGMAMLTHENLGANHFLNLSINLVILLVVFILARQLAGTRIALLAALFWSFYLPAIDLDSQISSEGMATLFVTSGVFLFARAQRRDQTRDWLASGVCIGLGALSRSVILFIGIALAISLIPRSHFGTRVAWHLRRVGLKSLTLFIVAFMVVMLPWFVRNYATFGRPVVDSTLTGYNLYRHNYLLSTDNYLRYVGPVEGWTAISSLLARRHDLKGTENEAQMDAVYQEEALQIIASEPKRYLTLSAYRFFPLWFNWGVKEAYGMPLKKSDYLIFVQQALFLVAAVVGLYGTWRRSWRLGMIILIVTCLHMAVVSQLRYIIIVMPLTITLSAIGCRTLLRSCLRLPFTKHQEKSAQEEFPM